MTEEYITINNEYTYAPKMSKTAYTNLCKYDHGNDLIIKNGFRLDSQLTCLEKFIRQPDDLNFSNLPGGLSRFCQENEKAGKYLKKFQTSLSKWDAVYMFDHARNITTETGALIGEMVSLYWSPALDTQLSIYKDYFKCLENEELRLIILPKEYS